MNTKREPTIDVDEVMHIIDRWCRPTSEANEAIRSAIIAQPIHSPDSEKLERLTIAAKAMIAIVGDGSFVSGGSLRRGAAQLADALK